MTDISHETIHMAEKEETNQNIEIVERPRRRQKMKTTTRTKEDRKTIKKQAAKIKPTTSWKTTHICNRNDIKTKRS